MSVFYSFPNCTLGLGGSFLFTWGYKRLNYLVSEVRVGNLSHNYEEKKKN